MPEFTAYFNGQWVPVSDVMIDPTDRGFFVGDTVFEVARTFNGKSFRMKEHIDRLYRSLDYARIDSGLSHQEMTDISEEAVERNMHLLSDVGDFTVHQFVTRGKGRRAWQAEDPTVGVKVGSIDRWFASAYDTGVHGVVTKTLSYSPEALDPKIKHYSRMNFNLAEIEANDMDAGALPIMRDDRGNLTEGSGYNVFLVKDGVVRTSDDRSVLQGVSRGMVLDLAKQLEMPHTQEELQPYDLYSADEAFFTSTSWCVLPVTYVDKRPIGDGKPGPVTKQLLAAWSEAVGVDIVDQAIEYASRP